MSNRSRTAFTFAAGFALGVVVIVPYYLLGHIFLPRLRRCEYGYDDFTILPHWEAWSSYVISPVLAGLLAFALFWLVGQKRLWPLALLVVLLTLGGLAIYTGGANCPD